MVRSNARRIVMNGSRSSSASGVGETPGPMLQMPDCSTLANFVRDQHRVRRAYEKQPAKRDSRALGKTADSADVFKVRLRGGLDLDLAYTRSSKQARKASDVETAPSRRSRNR